MKHSTPFTLYWC